MSSYITLNPNQTVYVKGIGYGTLISCGKLKNLSQKIQNSPLIKKQLLYFDPQMFNSDDSNHSKKSQQKQSQQEKNQTEQQLQNKKSQSTKIQIQPKNITTTLPVTTIDPRNITSVKLDNTNVMVYTPDINITKVIHLKIKPFLEQSRTEIILEIEITKTIDTLKKTIFHQLNQPSANYYNIRLFTINPTMTEINVNSKTISQYQLTDYSKLILCAQYGFTFKDVTNLNLVSTKLKLNLSSGNNILNSCKVVELDAQQEYMMEKKTEEKNKLEINTNKETQQKEQKGGKNSTQKITEQKTKDDQHQIKDLNDKANNKQQSSKNIKEKKEVFSQKLEIQNTKKSEKYQKVVQIEKKFLHVECEVCYHSGRHYWEIRAEKLTEQSQKFIIGVCLPNKDTRKNAPKYSKLWGYQPSVGKKIYQQAQNNRNHEQNIENCGIQRIYNSHQQKYGYICKNNDSIGVLLIFRAKKGALLTFYKNSICCQNCFILELSYDELALGLVPCINLSGQMTFTLDSRAPFPIDSYRFR